MKTLVIRFVVFSVLLGLPDILFCQKSDFKSTEREKSDILKKLVIPFTEYIAKGNTDPSKSQQIQGLPASFFIPETYIYANSFTESAGSFISFQEYIDNNLSFIKKGGKTEFKILEASLRCIDDYGSWASYEILVTKEEILKSLRKTTEIRILVYVNRNSEHYFIRTITPFKEPTQAKPNSSVNQTIIVKDEHGLVVPNASVAMVSRYLLRENNTNSDGKASFLVQRDHVVDIYVMANDKFTIKPQIKTTESTILIELKKTKPIQDGVKKVIIFDREGLPIANAMVSLFDRKSLICQTFTNIAGEARLFNIPNRIIGRLFIESTFYQDSAYFLPNISKADTIHIRPSMKEWSKDYVNLSLVVTDPVGTKISNPILGAYSGSGEQVSTVFLKEYSILQLSGIEANKPILIISDKPDLEQYSSFSALAEDFISKYDTLILGKIRKENISISIDEKLIRKCRNEVIQPKIKLVGGKPPYNFVITPPSGKEFRLDGLSFKPVQDGEYSVVAIDLEKRSSPPVRFKVETIATIGVQILTAKRNYFEGEPLILSFNPDNRKLTAAEWTGPANFKSFGNEMTIEKLLSKTHEGRYYLAVRENGCLVTDSVDIFVNPKAISVKKPVIKPSQDLFQVCEDTTISISILVENGVGPYTYKWTDPSGNPLFPNNPLKLSNLSPQMSGFYSVFVKDSKGNVSETFKIEVKVFPRPIVTIDPIDVNITTGKAFELKGSSPNIQLSKSDYLWITPGLVERRTDKITVPAATAADAGLYTLRATYKGCWSRKDVNASVKIQSLPIANDNSFNLVLIKSEFNVCENQQVKLQLKESTGKKPYVYFITSPDGKTEETPTGVFKPQTPGDFKVYVTDSLKSRSDLVIVKINFTEVIKPKIESTKPKPYEGDTIVLKVKNNNSQFQVSWSGPGITGTKDRELVIRNVQKGIHDGYYFVFLEKNSCFYKDSVMLKIREKPPIVAKSAGKKEKFVLSKQEGPIPAFYRQLGNFASNDRLYLSVGSGFTDLKLDNLLKETPFFKLESPELKTRNGHDFSLGYEHMIIPKNSRKSYSIYTGVQSQTVNSDLSSSRAISIKNVNELIYEQNYLVKIIDTTQNYSEKFRISSYGWVLGGRVYYSLPALKKIKLFGGAGVKINIQSQIKTSAKGLDFYSGIFIIGPSNAKDTIFNNTSDPTQKFPAGVINESVNKQVLKGNNFLSYLIDAGLEYSIASRFNLTGGVTWTHQRLKFDSDIKSLYRHLDGRFTGINKYNSIFTRDDILTINNFSIRLSLVYNLFVK